MTDWAAISSLATAGRTLVLVATFASVRSANRAARVAEQSLLDGLLPLLVTSRMQDPAEKVAFVGQHWIRVPAATVRPRSARTSSISPSHCATWAVAWPCWTAGRRIPGASGRRSSRTTPRWASSAG
ncbi:MAG TPA: hypothetical protein VMH35_09645 [Streptosporangiaceae bacterium]|nr:hypothetical protein [Streptosporangiaceae bacterium]